MRKGCCKHVIHAGIRTKCKLGYDPEQMALDATPLGENHKDGLAFRLPCQSREFQRALWHGMSPAQVRAMNSKATCDKFEEPTPQELANYETEIEKMISGVSVARTAILDDLHSRFEAGDRGVAFRSQSQSSVNPDLRNYMSGRGEIDCPVCKSGKLKYSRASYNGHIHAVCTSPGCVQWME